ncbi:ABC transporter substrate-binding protein [Saccharopolyspora erythraea]|uniref:ABC transporter substrate-binding protein n=1 Tax=Saccharopolyspora erythraea TaxID=1836 RepID=UPI001BACAA62|nr:ABC transporter substrate-binding protein [Saccharopolyspora erythraea]QUH02391.1 ABC transporter substrate-binding protein [Saccharopolyspora erythraea]
MKFRRATSVSIMISALVLPNAACGAGDREHAATEPLEGRGPITFVTGKDDYGVNPRLVAEWNRTHPSEPVRLIELPASGDEQRQQMIQNAQTRSEAFTVLDLDSVWVSEFAANRWITELPEEQFDTSKYLGPPVETALYRGRLFSVPASSDGAMLYYRKDLLDEAGVAPPTSLAELRQACGRVLALPSAAGMSCYTGQFEKYEGLVANFAEVVHGAGGKIVGDDGRPDVNTPQARQALDFLVSGLRSGMIPQQSIAFKEPESRRAFQEGQVVFSRWWPSQWSLLSKTDGSSAVAGKFAVTALPGLAGPGVSSLGGHNVAISSYGRNKATALDFIKFRAGEEQQRKYLEQGAMAPTIASLYDDPALRERYAYLPVLKQSIAGAEPRPRVVDYGEVTQAIQDEVYDALTGAKTSEQALADLQSRLEGLIEL